MLTDLTRVVVSARPPSRVGRKPKARGNEQTGDGGFPTRKPMNDPDLFKAGDAAEQLWRELVRRATAR